MIFWSTPKENYEGKKISSDINRMKPNIIAHRGHSQKYPENTMIAFKKAFEFGAYGVECDAHFTTDKKIVIHHYYELGKTDNGEGFIFDKSSSYLKSLDCGSWFDTKFKGERMPFLEELLTGFKDRIHYEIELKDFGREFTGVVLNTVKKNGLLEKVQFTSYQYPLLAYLKKREPKTTTGLISQPIPEWMDHNVAKELIKSSLIENVIDVIHCPVNLYDQKLIADLHSIGVKIHMGLCDSKEQLLKALELGADELTTNNLELAKTIFSEQL